MANRKIVTTVLILLLNIISFQDAFPGNFSDREPAEITISDREGLDWIIKRKLVIDNINNGIVSVYLSVEEFSAIQNAGFPVKWIPDYSKLKHDRYFSNRLKKQSKAIGPSYPTYTQLTSELENIATSYSTICKIESAGLSVEGRELWWIKISDNVNTEEAEPEVHFISTIHGDEPVGTVLCLEFIRYLATNYETDLRLKNLIDTTEIWIMPLMNPDGYVEGVRWNANGHDLNRSFPSLSAEGNGDLYSTTERQPEVIAIMEWSFNHTSVLSANFHTGALVVNYPFDYTQELCPDNDLFEYISLQYSTHNLPMYNTNDPISATNGIVRGIDWYQIDGGMQDWVYLATGGNQVTIELSSEEMPDVSVLPDLWDDNRESMLAYIETVHCGIKGIVTDIYSEEPLLASIKIDGNSHSVYTDPDVGDYHRMLLPGSYTITIDAIGYKPYSRTVIVADNIVSELNVQLESEEGGGGGCFISVAEK